MNKRVVHEISNYLHQIIGNAEHLSNSLESSEYAKKIKNAAYSIDALITDTTVTKKQIDISSDKKQIDLKQFAGTKVLIVDDMDENICIMESIFSALACEIMSAKSGEEAIEIFRDGFSPQIVCMDMIMPGIDGVTTTKELRTIGCDAYFIAISALKNQPHDVVCVFDSWLPKPFTLEHINLALFNYKTHNQKVLAPKEENIKLNISESIRDEIYSLATIGAYSELLKVISKVEDFKTQEFLNMNLKKLEFKKIIDSLG